MASGSYNCFYPVRPQKNLGRRHCAHIDPATGKVCGKTISGRNWSTRSPENKILLCENHIKSKIQRSRHQKHHAEIVIELDSDGRCLP